MLLVATIDDDFANQPWSQYAEVALQRATELGASHADFRVQRLREAQLSVRDAQLAGDDDRLDSGCAVRVLIDGVWGFAASDRTGPDVAVQLAQQAAQMAAVSAPLARERVELAPEPVYPDARWSSAWTQDPFEVPAAERTELLTTWSRQLMEAAGVNHVDIGVNSMKEQKFYADTAGTSATQQRVMIFPQVTVVGVNDDGAETMRTLAPPTARGWEYLTGDGWDLAAEIAELPELLRERMAAPSVEAGTYDLVIDPTNLWLTIHESVGHATELDRALGYEAAYAGTSFAMLDQLGTLQYGSELMNVTGDRTAEFGCATIGYDDEGVQAQSWDLISNGRLVGYQLDRRMAHDCGFGRSNGCAYADSAGHVPVQRMANVSLAPDPAGGSTQDLIAGVHDGLYVIGDKSWSIDMQRYNFQFTGQRFYRIRNGELAGQVRDAAYQGITPSFWGSLAALGGPQTYLLHGAPNCGKAQPGQVAWVSHGAPSALFTGVRVLNTKEEAGR